MKAGAFTPAIRCELTGSALDVQPLNEGGGLHPRNPTARVFALALGRGAQ